jgi:uncharacterized protein (TIGR00661 family)
MNILYAIQSDGMGHAMRSKQIIDVLKKKHTVIVATTARAKEIFDKKQRIIDIAQVHFHYQKNTVSYTKTTLQVIKNLPAIIRSVNQIRQILLQEKIDVVITDFEPICAYAAKIQRIALIEIDNIKSIPYLKDTQFSWRRYINILTSTILVPNPTELIITSDFTPQKKPQNIHWVSSILRPQITTLKPTATNIILIYQTSHTNDEQLITTLNQTPYEYVYYGCPTNEKRGNVLCKTFNQTEFLESMAQAKAIICNGGYTVVSEAMYLKKPLFICPIKHQYEQELNGKYIQQLAIGMTTTHITPQALTQFVSKIPNYNKHYAQIGKRTEPLKYILKIIETYNKKAKNTLMKNSKKQK